MTASNLPAGNVEPSASPAGNANANANINATIRQPNRPLIRSFCALVLLLAIFQFSENTADPDLWGHVVFGQHMLQTKSIAKTEFYSWTAAGQPWVNHECLAEVALGGAHALLGGSGLLLLKMFIGLLTFGISLRLGAAGLNWPARAVAWAVGSLALVEISYGFAARPQIFTAVFLALELLMLRKIHAGRWLWVLGLPVLFGIWINTHGGAMAGLGLLGLAAGATSMQWLWEKVSKKTAALTPVVVLWLGVAASTAALFCNPWGPGLLVWLIRSISWLRPEIEEWNPTPLGWDHAALFILIALAAFAWGGTRRRRALWELAACGAFALLALRSVRNAPLCGVVLLALMPPHLADVLDRFRKHLERLETLGGDAGFQKAATALFALATVGTAAATFTLHKEHPLTMEVPRRQYPDAAVKFLREHELRGRMLTFFDWGEMVIFELPDCPPSIDGRLDTCYSRELIAAHWKFYNAEPYDQKLLDPDQADLALLRSDLAGSGALARRPGWKVIYFDDTAVVMARNSERFPRLKDLALPVEGAKASAQGRAAFSNQSRRTFRP